jgi:hypothetical protein
MSDTGKLPDGATQSQLDLISAQRDMIDTGLQEIKNNVQGTVVGGATTVAGAVFGLGRLGSEAGEITGGTGWVRPKGWRLPKNGTWSGAEGNSEFIPSNPATLGLKEGETIPFKNGKPDFTKWSKGSYESKVPLTGNHQADRNIMKDDLADKQKQSGAEIDRLLKQQGVRLHHSGGNGYQLIPNALHDNIKGTGAACELRNGASQ